MRNRTIDIFRGLIMVIMAIDHVSYFVLETHFYEGYDYLSSHTEWLPFLTRFITHLCAPGFFFVLGYGAYKKYHKKQHFNIDLIKRGLLLITLQFTVINFIWQNNFIYVGVIFVLGSTLMLLNLLMPVLKKYGLYIGIGLMVLSQVVITETPLVRESSVLIRFFLVPGSLNDFYILYVITPWLGLACVGAYFSSRPKMDYIKLGLITLSLFVIIRVLGTFGNTHPITETLIGFLNVNKYPPSLAFITLTMGINFLLMSAIHRISNNPVTWPLKVFGQAALLFYILHLALYAFISTYFTTTSYTVMYMIWIVSLIMLYFPCRFVKKEIVYNWFKK